MSLRTLALLLTLPALAQGPRFTLRNAIQAEWARQPLTWTEAQKAALPPADRARLERTLARMGAPGAPALLPPELEKPTLETWEAKAKVARTPQERFTALFMLNRLKSPKALAALEGLASADAEAWPKHLHLEASIATARLNGAEVTPALQSFLDALQKTGKVDPVRAQAARLRLVMAGKEQALLPPIPQSPGSVLALLDAWNRAPWEQRAKTHAAMFQNPALLGADIIAVESTFRPLGILAEYPEGSEVPPPPPMDPRCFPASRLFEGLGKPAPAAAFPAIQHASAQPRNHAGGFGKADPMTQIAAITALQKFDSREALQLAESLAKDASPNLSAALLPTLRGLRSKRADAFRSKLLKQANPIARAAAVEDCPSAPTNLAALTRLTWKDKDFDAQQILIQSYARWKLPVEEQKTQLRPWLQHPDWACRWEAYQALVKLDPATPWPSAPKQTRTDRAILREATRLAERGKAVRLRITFSGKRSVTLRLDPTVAPMNIANLVLLARKGYFNGRRVPRVVPDFVVQMGSPYDTMDGGPGYTVRCENSLDWYGPGSVGMALSGKDTGGSQFFITTNATPHLTGKYTRLGEVEDLDRALSILDDLELGAKILSIKALEP
jgi:cyclophilin family peptidyl-prolyl cis-trans isomerase/HEAT repeat protein